MTEGAFLSLWNKYVSVIRILLKRSLVEEQKITIGKLELNSADNRKNANYTFTLEIIKGKTQGIGSKPISKDLFFTLNTDPVVNKFMADKIIVIGMGKNGQLTLKSDLAEPVEAEANN